MRASLLPLVSILAVVSCAPPPIDDSSTSTDQLGVAHFESVSDVTVSQDGAFALLTRVTLNGMREIVRVSTDSGTSRAIDRYDGGDRVLSVKSHGNVFYYVMSHPDGAWELRVHDPARATPEREFQTIRPLHAGPNPSPPPSEVVITPDSKWVLFEARGVGLSVVPLGANAPMVTFGMSVWQLLPSPDGRHVLVRGYEGFHTLDLTGTPTLSPPVTGSGPYDFHSYDGTSVLGTTVDTGSKTDGNIVAINTRTGMHTQLASNMHWPTVVAERGPYVWYIGSRREVEPWYDALVRVTRDGSSPSIVLATGAHSIDAVLSSDGTTILFTKNYGSALFAVPADGTAPARLLRPAQEKPLKFMKTAGPRVLIIEGREWRSDAQASVLDDITGATMASFPAPEGVPVRTLSDDGTTIYGSRPCVQGAITGYEVFQHRAGDPTLLPCTVGADAATFATIPGRAAVFASALTFSGASQVTLVRP